MKAEVNLYSNETKEILFSLQFPKEIPEDTVATLEVQLYLGVHENPLVPKCIFIFIIFLYIFHY